MILRPYQTDAMNAVLNYFDSGADGHPLIVMPTGTGKSLVIAALIQRVLTEFPTARVLMLTHVKELIQQNLDKLLRVWPDAPVGVYSAGLRSYHTDAPILFCGIQSVWNKAKSLASEQRPIELIFIDEAHRVPLHDGGTYRRFIADLSTFNPCLRLIGLTATPYRWLPATKTMSGGYQTLVQGEDRLFTDIVLDLTTHLVGLIQQDYLAALWPEPTRYQVDISGVGIQNGDYREDQLNDLLAEDAVVNNILDEAIPLAQADRREHWLVFCAGVDQAQAMTTGLQRRGVRAALVTGATSHRDRAQALHEFQAGRLTALVSVGVLTTGFDAPLTDCIIMARPTLSPILYCQIMGRGMRPTPAKIAVIDDKKRGCLVLDFCDNVDRHGPLDRLKLKAPAQKKSEPTKICPQCQTEIRALTNPCPQCGHLFPQNELEKELPTLGKKAIIAGITPPKITRYAVSQVLYSRYVGQSGIPTLRVDYYSGFLRIISEWVCLEHPVDGYPRKKAERWWKQRQPCEFMLPGTVEQALDWIKGGFELTQPTVLHVQEPTHTAYPEIVKYEWPTVEIESAT